MKIIELIIQNFKNIELIDITPTGDTVIISGENGAGKSAVLDAFWMALDQKGASKENPDPIKHGEKHAKVVVNLGKYIVTRTWTETKSYLKIENAEGAVFKGPGAMLASLIGELSFDPQAFSLMSEKDQRDTLIKMLDLDIDIPLLDAERKRLYSERTLVNRDIKNLNGQIEGIVVPDNVPDDEQSTTDIMTDYETASQEITKNNEIRSAYSDAKDFVTTTAQRVAEASEQLDLLNEQLDIAVANELQLETKVTELVDPDLEIFKCKITDLEETNNLVRKKIERDVISNELTTKMTTSNGITSAIEDIDNQKAYAIEQATLPVPGLSFDESGVLYNDVPMKGCSAGEQLRVSVAMAMALNPKIRIIRITDGSLLDSSNMKVIEEMARENDFQVWIERVNESGKIGVFIQEGKVVKDNQAPVHDNDRAQSSMPGLSIPGSTK